MITPNGYIPSEDGNFLDRTTSPTAVATLDLLNTVRTMGEATAGEIIEVRHGGIYPTRTQQELSQLQEAGLLGVDEKLGAKMYAATKLGQLELELQGVKNPLDTQKILDETLGMLEADPPILPDEKYGNEEFRFTWASVRELLGKIVVDNANIKPKILALGAPTIAYFASQCPDVAQCCLLDVNEDIVNDLNLRTGSIMAAQYDAREPIPSTFAGKFDAVVFDPPWHNEFYYLFADRSHDLLRPNGRIYLSTPAPATRPEAASELAEIYRRYMHGGYDIVEITPEFFGYQIPRFEAEVFTQQGIEVRSRGKYGQLVVAQARLNRSATCSDPESLAKANIETVHSLKGHDDADIGDLYLRGEDNVEGELSIEPYGDGTYLTTSRSQRRREGVNFITRDHKAFKIANPRRFLEIVSGLRAANGDVREVARLLSNDSKTAAHNMQVEVELVSRFMQSSREETINEQRYRDTQGTINRVS